MKHEKYKNSEKSALLTHSLFNMFFSYQYEEQVTQALHISAERPYGSFDGKYENISV